MPLQHEPYGVHPSLANYTGKTPIVHSDCPGLAWRFANDIVHTIIALVALAIGLVAAVLLAPGLDLLPKALLATFASVGLLTAALYGLKHLSSPLLRLPLGVLLATTVITLTWMLRFSVLRSAETPLEIDLPHELLRFFGSGVWSTHEGLALVFEGALLLTITLVLAWQRPSNSALDASVQAPF